MDRKQKQAGGGNPHYVNGPDLHVDGRQVTVSGSVAGLGNADIDVTVNVSGIVSTSCRNPGGNIAPGQDATFATSQTVSRLETKNGRVDYRVVVHIPGDRVDLDGVCPNRKWTPQVTGARPTGVSVTVSRDGVELLENELT